MRIMPPRGIVPYIPTAEAGGFTAQFGKKLPIYGQLFCFVFRSLKQWPHLRRAVSEDDFIPGSESPGKFFLMRNQNDPF